MTISRTQRILPTLFCVFGSFYAFHFPMGARAASEGTFTGSQSCSTSGCHGGAGDKSKQYTIWFRADAHSRAYGTLTTARSQRMAESLEIQNPSESHRCTECHAPLSPLAAPLSAKGPRPEEGVSCESCHGAAGNWIRSHTRPDYTRAQRISSGMRDLEDLYLRANTCVACHQVIAEDIIKAGHPRLSFELEGHSGREPRHWKEIWLGPQAWIVGKTATLRELSGKYATSGADAALKDDWELNYWLLKSTGPALGENWKLPSNAAKADMAFVKSCDSQAKALALLSWSTDHTLLLLRNLFRSAGFSGSTPTSPGLSQQKIQKVSETVLVFANDLPPVLQERIARPLQNLKDFPAGTEEVKKALVEIARVLEEYVKG